MKPKARMAKTDQSRFETHLPVMKKNKVAAGCYRGHHLK